MFNKFFSTLSLVCRIPFKPRYTFDLSRADFYLPIIGLFPALLGAGAYWIGGGNTVTVFVMLIIQYLGFNLFHLDGLADTADAFLGDFDREKRFAILKDSRIGVYGLFGALAVLSLKGAFLGEMLGENSAPKLLPLFPELFAYPISGRFAAALIPGSAAPAKPDGLGALLKDASRGRALAGAVIALGLWSGIFRGICAAVYGDCFYGIGARFWAMLFLVPPLLGALVALGISRMYQKHLGGYTGDALGATVELAELAHLGGTYLFIRLCAGLTSF